MLEHGQALEGRDEAEAATRPHTQEPFIALIDCSVSQVTVDRSVMDKTVMAVGKLTWEG